MKIQMFSMACILAATAVEDCKAVVLPQEMAIKNTFEGTIAENTVAAQLGIEKDDVQFGAGGPAQIGFSPGSLPKVGVMSMSQKFVQNSDQLNNLLAQQDRVPDDEELLVQLSSLVDLDTDEMLGQLRQDTGLDREELLAEIRDGEIENVLEQLTQVGAETRQ